MLKHSKLRTSCPKKPSPNAKSYEKQPKNPSPNAKTYEKQPKTPLLTPKHMKSNQKPQKLKFSENLNTKSPLESQVAGNL